MSNLLDAVWVDYLDPEFETTGDEYKLLTAARAEPGLASVWAADVALDCSLRSLQHLAVTEEAFVAEWERRAGELAEPPIAEPPLPSVPVSSVQVFTSAPQVTAQRRANRSSLQSQSTAVLVATVALLALVAVSLWIFRGNGGIARREVPPKKSPPLVDTVKQPKSPEAETDEPFRFKLPPEAAPTQITPVVWQTGGPQNNRLPRGEHRLTSGLVELVGGKATPVTLAAPAMVKIGDDDSWFVQQGTVVVSDPPGEERLQVATPNSRIRSQGADFEVTVNDEGQTDVVVRRGEVHLLSGAAGEKGVPLKLLAGEFERAQLSPPGKEPGTSPAFCQLQGPADRFCGLIQLDGETLRFGMPEEFEKFQKEVEEQFAKDAEELRQQWPDLVRALGGLGGGEIQLERDGKQLEIETLEQLMEFLKKLPMPPGLELKPGIPKLPKPMLPKPGEGNSSFQGTIIINGQEQKFNSLEEFNAARKKALEQLGPLPIQPPGIPGDLPGIPKDFPGIPKDLPGLDPAGLIPKGLIPEGLLPEGFDPANLDLIGDVAP